MKIKRMLRVLSLVLLAAISLSVCVFGGIKASAQEAPAAPDKIVSDFSSSNTEGWTLNESAVASSEGIQVIAGGTVTSETAMRSFLMQITFGVLNKGFEVAFGDSQNACSVRFDGAHLRLNGLTTETGGSVYVMNNTLTQNSIVQIEVVGGEVTISVKLDGEPYDALGTPVTTLSYAEGIGLSDGKITLSAYEGGMFSLRKINVYSLNAGVNIEKEDYVAPVTPEEPKDEKGCKSVTGSAVAVCAVLSVAGIILFGRRKNNEEIR